MHEVDQKTEQMVRSVLAYAENRLRMNPVPLDKGVLPADELYDRLDGLIRETPRQPDEVLGVYTSVIAPSIISADSPRFLGFIPAAPTKASLLFDMLVSCASIQGISWLEASGAIAAENSVLRRDRRRGRAADNLRGLLRLRWVGGQPVCARGGPRDREEPRRHRAPAACVVGSDAHSSIINTLRLLEMDALVVDTPNHRLTGDAVRDAVCRGRPSDIAAVVCTSGTTNAGIIDDLAGVGALARERRLVVPRRRRLRRVAASSRARCARNTPGSSRPTRSSSTRTSGCSRPFDCCALIYREPELARATHTQDASYLDVIHTSRRRVEPDGLRLPPDAPGPRSAAVVLSRGARPRGLPRCDRGRPSHSRTRRPN